METTATEASMRYVVRESGWSPGCYEVVDTADLSTPLVIAGRSFHMSPTLSRVQADADWLNEYEAKRIAGLDA